MIAAMSILGVVFWVWAIDALVNDDDDDNSETTEVEPEGDDIPVNEGDNDLLLGLEDDDTLSGDVGEDVLVGNEGDDELSGGADDDLLLGGEGDDLVEGDEGGDVLFGGEGEDTLNGGSGADLIDGTDRLDEDQLIASLQTAETSDDLVIEFAGEQDNDTGDVIDAGAGEDIILMGSDDSVTGGADGDLFAGGWWIRPGDPAIVEDYDEDEDLLTYTYEGTTAPAITTDIDAASGDATVFADGEEVIVVINAGPSFNASNVTLLQA